MNAPEIAFSACFLLVWIAGAIGVIFYARAARRTRLLAFAQQAAAQLGGQALFPPDARAPVLHYQIGDARVELRLARDDGRSGFIFESLIDLPRHRVVTIRPCSTFGRITRLFRLAVAETGDDAFDHDFTVESNDAGLVRTWLDADARRTIRNVSALVAPEDLEISLASNRLRIESRTSLQFQSSLVAVADGAAEIVRALCRALEHKLGELPSIEFLASPAVADTVGNCQVCGDPVAEDRVSCRNCRTPHHRECWEYLGGCSTFACGTRHYDAHGSASAS